MIGSDRSVDLVLANLPAHYFNLAPTEQCRPTDAPTFSSSPAIANEGAWKMVDDALGTLHFERCEEGSGPRPLSPTCCNGCGGTARRRRRRYGGS